MLKNILFFTCILISGCISAHPGGVDDNGGHLDRSTGLYHCHREDCVEPLPPEADTSEEDYDEIETLDSDNTTPEFPTFTASSWSKTKKIARDQIYFDKPITFYCGCDYEPTDGSGGVVDTESCDYESNNQPNAHRETVMEWEHIVPASLMPARKFTCWNEGLKKCSKAGRACCEQHDLNARVQIFDLHNLAPSIGQVNALRSDSRYGILKNEKFKLGDCKFKWNKEVSEPPDNRKGDVARVWLYYHSLYDLELESGELEMYLKWSDQDKPDSFEIKRNQRIKEIQGNSNPYIDAFL